MDETAPARLGRWHDVVYGKDLEGMRAFLAEDVRFHSPVFWRPTEGRDAVHHILSTVIAVFEDFRYLREQAGESTWFLEFEARVGEFSLKGVDVIQFDAAGQIQDFEVMIRPANALQALGLEMARRLAS